MMFGIIDLWTYVVGVVFIILLPGPNSIYVFSLAAQHGVRSAYLGILGVFVGDTILMALAATGVSSLLGKHPELFNLVKWVGAAYLSWMGAKLLYTTWKKWREHKAEQAAARQGLNPQVNEELDQQLSTRLNSSIDAQRPFSRGLMIDLLNPEAVIFFISFFIQFVDPAYPYPALSFTLLGIILQTVSVAYLSLLVFAGAWLAALFRHRRWLTVSAESGAGALFIGFGVKLATMNAV